MLASPLVSGLAAHAGWTPLVAGALVAAGYKVPDCAAASDCAAHPRASDWSPPGVAAVHYKYHSLLPLLAGRSALSTVVPSGHNRRSAASSAVSTAGTPVA